MITLWGRNNSTNVKKVRWVLEELDLPYQQILAGLEFGLNHDPEYLAMNPNGLVPLLKDDATGVVLWESNTIIRYLAAQYGVDRLWLAAPAQRAQGGIHYNARDQRNRSLGGKQRRHRRRVHPLDQQHGQHLV